MSSSSRVGVTANSRSTVVGRDAFALGGEAQHQAMPQHRLGQGLDVVAGDVRAALQQCAGLGAQDRNCTARGPAPQLDLLLDEIGHAGLADARLPHQRQRVADDVVRDRHLADDLLQFDNLLGASAPARSCRQRGGGAPGHLELLVEVRILTNILNMKRSCCASGSG